MDILRDCMFFYTYLSKLKTSRKEDLLRCFLEYSSSQVPTIFSWNKEWKKPRQFTINPKKKNCTPLALPSGHNCFWPCKEKETKKYKRELKKCSYFATPFSLRLDFEGMDQLSGKDIQFKLKERVTTMSCLKKKCKSWLMQLKKMWCSRLIKIWRFLFVKERN